MITSSDRKIIRKKAREGIKENAGLIIGSIFIYGIVSFIAQLFAQIPFIGFFVSFFVSFVLISRLPFLLKVYRQDNLEFDDVFTIFTGGKFTKYLLTWLLNIGIGFCIMIPLMVVMMIGFFTLGIGAESFGPLNTYEDFNAILPMIAPYVVGFIIFIVFFIIFMFVISIVLIFVQFVYYATHDAKEMATVGNIYKLCWEITKGNRVSYILMGFYFVFLSMGLGAVYGVILGLTIAIDIPIVGLIFLLPFMFVFSLLNNYALATYAGFYQKLVINFENKELVEKVIEKSVLDKYIYKTHLNDEEPKPQTINAITDNSVAVTSEAVQLEPTKSIVDEILIEQPESTESTETIVDDVLVETTDDVIETEDDTTLN